MLYLSVPKIYIYLLICATTALSNKGQFGGFTKATGPADIGESCIAGCRDGLVCANDFDSEHSESKNFTCTMKWTPELENLSKNITDGYIQSFLKQLESNVSYNIHALGEPLIAGTHVENVIPTEEEERRADINNEIKAEFGDDCIATFPIIAKESIRYVLNNFLKNTKYKLSERELKTQKEKLRSDILDRAQKKMTLFVEESWTAYKADTYEAFEEMTK